MHYFSKCFCFSTVILGTFFTNGKTPFCNTSIFHIVKGSFCTFVTERSAYMEIFILREKKLSDFNIYYFQLCFLYISVLRNLYNKARTCVDATNLQRRDPDGLGSRTQDLNRILKWIWQQHGKNTLSFMLILRIQKTNSSFRYPLHSWNINYNL